MITPFSTLNLVQFFAAINENLYKLLAAYFIISILGDLHSNAIMALIGAIFIIPFLLFSPLGGIFADKWPKSKVTKVTRCLELTCLLLAISFFYFKIITGVYVVLFLMASLSAVFGPSKYGMIPELMPKEKILYANSVIAAFTYLGIIIGTALPSILIWISDKDYIIALLVSVCLAIIGLILSLFLPVTPVENKQKSVRFFIYLELFDSLKQMWTIPSLFSAAFAYAYFLFIGGFVQLNIIPYTIKNLGLTDIMGGYFFLVTAFGLGLGSYFTNKICKGKIKLEMIPLSGISISILLMLFKWFFAPWPIVFVWMFLLGFFGGIFVVPPQAFILANSPEEDRGRNVATANFFSFAFALLAAFVLYVFTLLDLHPATNFLIIGVINFFVILALLYKTRWFLFFKA